MSDSSSTIAPRPLRRIKFGVLCLAGAFVCLAASGAMPGVAAPLRMAAITGAILSLGSFVASALAVASYVSARLKERYPSQTHRAGIVLGVAVMFLLGVYAVALSVLALLSTRAPVIARHAGSVAKAVDPTYFWASVMFHFLLGAFLIGGSIYAAAFHGGHREP